MLRLLQLAFDFAFPPARTSRSPASAPAPPPKGRTDRRGAVQDPSLEAEARGWIQRLGLGKPAAGLRVEWNSRLRSTAGFAHFPEWRIELNPRLRELDGEVERTLKHELAHLIAYHRAGRRIAPHGREWRRACADLGIPGERARHALPLPRAAVSRKLVYACPACRQAVRRARRFRRPTACRACCDRHSGGEFDPRFRLRLVSRDS